MKGNLDENSRIVGKAYAPDITDYVQPILVNPITSKLKIEIIPKKLNPLVINKKNIPVDDNIRQTAAGVGNNANQSLAPLTVDLIQGVPCLRIVIV